MRGALLDRFRNKIASGAPLRGGAAADAAAVRALESAGADFAVFTKSGGRAAVAGMLPVADANADVLDRARDIVGAALTLPVLAGVCGTDPLRLMGNFLAELGAAGFAGVQNVPTVGIVDGSFRRSLEETQLGYDREVEMVRLARGLELLTAALAFTPDEAARMARAGADLVIAHAGLSKEPALKKAQDIAESARAARRDVLVLLHGAGNAKEFDGRFDS